MYLKSTSISITPTFPVYLAGFTRKQEKIDTIHTDLELSICQLKSDESNLIIASFDLLFITDDLEDFFQKVVSEIYTLDAPKNIILTATHTHYAPCIENRINLGTKDLDYVSFLKQKIKESISTLYKLDFIECESHVEKFQFDRIIANRRRQIKPWFSGAKTVMEPVESNRPNDVLSVLSFRNENKVVVKLAIFACHPTNLYTKDAISAEYIDVVRTKLKTNNEPVLFLQGFSGDIRAYPPKKYRFHRLFYNLLSRSYPLKYYRFDKDQYENWLSKLSDSIDIKNLVFSKSEKNPKFYFQQSKLLVEKMGLISSTAPDLVIKLLDFEAFCIIFISGEVLSGYQQKIEKLFDKQIFGVGYSGNCFGYLPTSEDVEKGGYEVVEFKKGFGIEGNWVNGFENEIFQVIETLKK